MNELWQAAGAAAWGAAAFGGLLPFISEEGRIRFEMLCPGAKTVLIGAFPYFSGTFPGNLSLYCRGEDYHTVLIRRLQEICRVLEQRYPGSTFCPGTDNWPLPELQAARQAGIGFIGKHGLCIVPPYGSYVFLGSIVTNRDFPHTGPEQPCQCPDTCSACVKSCPTGALSPNGYKIRQCLSFLTQEKGDLDSQAETWIRNSTTIWGCDLCQTACPFNRKAHHTAIPEFSENLIHSLTFDSIDALSNKAFRRKFSDRAFSWRGITPLRRNLNLHRKK